jgi:hypothetical protein
MLFEFISPENRIVVDYSAADIFLLGVVSHSEFPRLHTHPDSLQGFINFYNMQVQPAAHYTEPVREIMRSVSSWDNDEGVVVSCHFKDRNPVLFKVKSSWYLMMHALRFQMTTKKMYQLLVLKHQEIHSFEDFQAYLYSKGYDFEIAEILEDEVNTYFDKLNAVTLECRRVSKWCRDHEHLSRKEFVQTFKSTFPTAERWEFPYAMASYDKRGDTLYFPMAEATQESVRTIKSWLQDETLEQTLLKNPKDFEDDNEDS